MSETGWSLSEAQSLCVKATRGGGYDWGLAEEAGFAVHWLQARGAPGVEALAALLDAGCSAQTCPLTLGAALCDGALSLADLQTPMTQPLLIVPFVVTAVGAHSHRVSWDDTVCDVAATGINLDGNPLCPLAEVAFQKLPQAPFGACVSRVPSQAKPAMRRLAIHAHATYAPATEASRLAGAGAGLDDND